MSPLNTTIAKAANITINELAASIPTVTTAASGIASLLLRNVPVEPTVPTSTDSARIPTQIRLMTSTPGTSSSWSTATILSNSFDNVRSVVAMSTSSSSSPVTAATTSTYPVITVTSYVRETVLVANQSSLCTSGPGEPELSKGGRWREGLEINIVGAIIFWVMMHVLAILLRCVLRRFVVKTSKANSPAYAGLAAPHCPHVRIPQVSSGSSGAEVAVQSSWPQSGVVGSLAVGGSSQSHAGYLQGHVSCSGPAAALQCGDSTNFNPHDYNVAIPHDGALRHGGYYPQDYGGGVEKSGGATKEFGGGVSGSRNALQDIDGSWNCPYLAFYRS